MTKLRLVVLLVCCLMALVGVWALFVVPMQQTGPSVTTSETFQIGGPFELTDHTGALYSSENLKGRPHLIFFGFTHCPDICPTTLQELSTHLGELGARADAIVPIFITVDPSRDTPEKLGSYLAAFDKRIIGLSGSEDEIAKVAKLYRAFYEKVPSESGGYSMNHAASVYMFDRDGRFVSTLSWQEKPVVRQAKLEKLTRR